MGLKLVIAEKPSVAQSIAKVIGSEKKRDGYLDIWRAMDTWSAGALDTLLSWHRRMSMIRNIRNGGRRTFRSFRIPSAMK